MSMINQKMKNEDLDASFFDKKFSLDSSLFEESFSLMHPFWVYIRKAKDRPLMHLISVYIRIVVSEWKWSKQEQA